MAKISSIQAREIIRFIFLFLVTMPLLGCGVIYRLDPVILTQNDVPTPLANQLPLTRAVARKIEAKIEGVLNKR